MSMRAFATNRISKVAVLGLLPLAALTVHAQDDGRLDRLESEVQALKLRLSKLEAAQGGQAAEQKPVASGQGWKSLSNWRKLKAGMSPDDVRSILGEPGRVNGGDVAFWYYSNDGRATFMQDKLHGWVEPR